MMLDDSPAPSVIGNYRVDGEDASLRASGLDVIDFSMAKTIRSWVDFNFSIGNLTNKRYFETQNYFEPRLRPGDPVITRIHGTPGYPFGVTAGLPFGCSGKANRLGIRGCVAQMVKAGGGSSKVRRRFA